MKKVALIAAATAFALFLLAGSAFESFAAGVEKKTTEAVMTRGQ